MRFHPALLTTLALLVSVENLKAEEPASFFFKKGDRVTFLGDSITAQYQYSTDIELYLTTRFPRGEMFFLNSGIGGDVAPGGAGRFERHVLDDKPTAVTINFGMNDGGYGAFDPKRHEAFLKGTESMLAAAKKANARVALVSPNAVDRRMQQRFKQYMETQKQFYAPLKEIAARNHVAFVDQYATTRSALEKMESDDAKEVKPFPDGIHTSSEGGLLMAHAILTGLHAPALVSQADIDVAGGKTEAKACTVKNLEASADRVAFDRLDEALPLPMQKDWEPLLPYVNQLKDLNWYGLKVTGLVEGSYALTIDGKQVAKYSSEDLAKGVNLGNLTSGPIHDQGQKVFDTINEKNKVVQHRFNTVMRFQAPDWLADVAAKRRPIEVAKDMGKIIAVQEEIYKLVKPESHRFELKKAE